MKYGDQLEVVSEGWSTYVPPWSDLPPKGIYPALTKEWSKVQRVMLIFRTMQVPLTAMRLAFDAAAREAFVAGEMKPELDAVDMSSTSPPSSRCIPAPLLRPP